jgi:hypothetical protein
VTAEQEINAALKGEGCLGKAAPDEPVFVLRAQDIYAAMTVRWWAGRLLNAASHVANRSASHAKAMEALALADEMDKWPNRKVPD